MEKQENIKKSYVNPPKRHVRTKNFERANIDLLNRMEENYKIHNGVFTAGSPQNNINQSVLNMMSPQQNISNTVSALSSQNSVGSGGSPFGNISALLPLLTGLGNKGGSPMDFGSLIKNFPGGNSCGSFGNPLLTQLLPLLKNFGGDRKKKPKQEVKNIEDLVKVDDYKVV